MNRIVTWTPEGIKYEADQRHGEIILKQLGLQEEGAKAVLTPGVKQELGTTEEELEELSIKEASLYRAMTARGNYLSQDRSDVQYAVKGIKQRNVLTHSDGQKSIKEIRKVLA